MTVDLGTPSGMKTSILSLVTFFASFAAQASNFADPNLAAITNLQPQQIPGIEVALARPVSAELGLKKFTFEVQWEKTLCSAVESPSGSVSGGACVFTALVNGNGIAQVGAIIRGQTLVAAHVISLGR